MHFHAIIVMASFTHGHLARIAKERTVRESKYEALFSSMLRMAGITDYKREHRFDAVRKWRFDFIFLYPYNICDDYEKDKNKNG